MFKVGDTVNVKPQEEPDYYSGLGTIVKIVKGFGIGVHFPCKGTVYFDEDRLEPVSPEN